MSLKFNCSNPECRRRIEVEDALAGAELSCPACGVTLHVPLAHDVRFVCANKGCGQHLVVDVAEAGRFMKCPACGKVQRVPGDPPKPLAPPLEAKSAGKGKPPPGSAPRFKAPRRWMHEDQCVAWFFVVALVGLVGFGLAKISTLWMQPGFPPGRELVFEAPRSVVMPGLGLVECAVAGLCVWGASARVAAWLLLWYAVNWWVYRLGQAWLGQPEPLPALGAAGDLLGVPAVVADRLMMMFSACLAAGAMVIVWRQTRSGKEPENQTCP